MSTASEIHAYASEWKRGCSHDSFGGCPECNAAFVHAVERILDRRDQRALMLQQRETAFGAALVTQTMPVLDLMLRYPEQTEQLLAAMQKMTDNCTLAEHLKTIDKILALVDK